VIKEEANLLELVVTKPKSVFQELSQQSTFACKYERVPKSIGLTNFNYQKQTSYENDVVAVKSCIGKNFGVALIFRNGYETPV